MNGFTLTSRRRSGAVRLQVDSGEWSRVLLVGVQSQDQRGAFLNDTDARMTSSVNPSLMPFGQTKPSLQVQVVSRQVHSIAASKQTRSEACHHLGEVFVDRILLASKPLTQHVELRLALVTASRRWIQHGADAAYLIGERFDLFERLSADGPAPINASG